MVSRGIDISKSSFVAAYPSTNGNPTKTFPNTTAGMRELIGTLAVAEHHCVMEATSNYGCCCTCYIRTVLPSVLPPPPKKKQIKHFSRMMMPVTKTDEKDAYMIAMYGEKMNPPIYKMPSQATIRILTTEGFTYFDNANLPPHQRHLPAKGRKATGTNEMGVSFYQLAVHLPADCHLLCV